MLWSLLRLFRALCGASDADKGPGRHQQAQTCVCAEDGNHGRQSEPQPSRQTSRRQALHGLRTAPVRVVLFVSDVLFGLICGCVLILLLYYTNDGQFRFLALLGMGCGFFVWRHTLGLLADALTDVMVRGLHRLVRLLMNLFRMLFRILVLWPLRMLYRLWMAVCGRRFAARRVRLAKERAKHATDAWFEAQVRQASCGFRAENTASAADGTEPVRRPKKHRQAVSENTQKQMKT